MSKKDLFNAIETGDSTKVQQIISQTNKFVNSKNNKGDRPLFIAAQKGYLEIAEYLIKNGAKVNDGCKKKKEIISPLFIAAQNGHKEIVDLLIREKANVNLVRNDKISPLFIAVQREHQEIVSALIVAGANINNAGKNDATPLLIALKVKNNEAIAVLIKAGANIFQHPQTYLAPLYKAIQSKNLEAVNLLLEAGAGIFANLLHCPDTIDFSGKIVIGMKIDGERVNHETKGFENAITSVDELKQAIADINDYKEYYQLKNRLLKACQFLMPPKKLRFFSKKSPHEKNLTQIMHVLNSPHPTTPLTRLCLNQLQSKKGHPYLIEAHKQKRIPPDLYEHFDPKIINQEETKSHLSMLGKNFK